MRVHELAKEMGVTSKEVLAQLRDVGVEVKNPMSEVDDAALARLRGEIPPEAEAPPEPEAPEAVAAEEPPEPEPEPVAETQPGPEPEPEPEAEPELQAAESEPGAEAEAPDEAAAGERVIRLRSSIVVKDLADLLELKPNVVIAELMGMNILAAINQRVEASVARQIAEKRGFTVEQEKKGAAGPAIKPKTDEEPEADDRPEDLMPRPPVVTFLGHVDHGKTSLLDHIRSASVAAGEAGGITQHIGAYTVDVGGRKITFLDTPGHAAFTAMRARGANLTDIAVIVVAADDGLMPQTREAIQHAQAAGVALIFAINKIDLPTADVNKALQQLQAEGLAPEEWGGDVICCHVSAQTGEGMDHLLEMILLQAEMLQLTANPRRRAEGFVVEAQLEPGMGPTANVLVKRGSLSVGDVVLCGTRCGRIRALIDDHGRKVKTAGPSMPVKCLGLPGVPGAGDLFRVYANEKAARSLASGQADEEREQQLHAPVKASLEGLFDQLQKEAQVDLRIVLKADTQGSVEAIVGALNDIGSEKVLLNFILTGTGDVIENDVMLASASDAVILGFHVGKEPGVESTAKHEGVEIRLHRVIYELIDEVRDAMLGLLKPVLEENVRGRAEVKQVFTLSKTSKIAGCMVVSGNIRPSYRVRVIRGEETLGEGRIESLKHFQDAVNEVREAQECGVRLEKGMDYEVGDILECFELTEVAQSL